MSFSDRAERISHLRRAVEAVGRDRARASRPAAARPRARRQDSAAASRSTACTRSPRPRRPTAPAAFGFALSLAARFMAARGAGGLLAVEEFALTQNGAPFGPGLVAHGLDLSRLVFVRAPDAATLFQTLEDALKSGALAVVVGELWRLPKYDLAVSRRLTLAARAGADAGAADAAARAGFERRRDALRGRRRAERARTFRRRGAAAAGGAGGLGAARQGARRRERRPRSRARLPADLA